MTAVNVVIDDDCDDDDDIANRLICTLVARRNALGLPRTEIARRIGTSPQALCQFETGQLVGVNLYSVLAYARAVDMDVEITVTPHYEVFPPRSPSKKGIRSGY